LEKTTRPRKPYTLLIAWPLAAAGIVVFWNALYWQGLKMSVSVATLTSLLAPVAFAAAVVERAVEILISRGAIRARVSCKRRSPPFNQLTGS